MKLGVVIGRFQVPQLHSGHESLISHALNENDRVLIVVGTRPTPMNATNPLSFDIIEQVIKATYADNPITILLLPDYRSDKVWSDNVDMLIDIFASSKPTEVSIYSGRDGFASYYKGKYDVKPVDFNMSHVNGTEIRQECLDSRYYGNTMWRTGYIAAMQALPHRTYYTVDMALIRDSCNLPTGDGRAILLAKKPNEDKWRFPGGFVEPGETFAQAAGRELMEETGLATLDGFKIVKDFVIDDWRMRGQKGVGQTTVLCIGRYYTGLALAQDDVSELVWVNFDYVHRNQMKVLVDEHRGGMIEALDEYMERTKY